MLCRCTSSRRTRLRILLSRTFFEGASRAASCCAHGDLFLRHKVSCFPQRPSLFLHLIPHVVSSSSALTCFWAAAFVILLLIGIQRVCCSTFFITATASCFLFCFCGLSIFSGATCPYGGEGIEDFKQVVYCFSSKLTIIGAIVRVFFFFSLESLAGEEKGHRGGNKRGLVAVGFEGCVVAC